MLKGRSLLATKPILFTAANSVLRTMMTSYSILGNKIPCTLAVMGIQRHFCPEISFIVSPKFSSLVPAGHFTNCVVAFDPPQKDFGNWRYLNAMGSAPHSLPSPNELVLESPVSAGSSELANDTVIEPFSTGDDCVPEYLMVCESLNTVNNQFLEYVNWELELTQPRIL